MRAWLMARTAGESGWVESSLGVDVGINELKVGRLVRPIAMTAAPYLPPKALRVHEALLERCGLRPGLYPGICVLDQRIMLGPLVGIMVSKRQDVPFSPWARKLLAANEQVGCLLYFFEPTDVHRQQASVTGMTFSPTTGWEQSSLPLPDVLYDHTDGYPLDLRQYLLHRGTKPLNQAKSAADVTDLLASTAALTHHRVRSSHNGSLTVLMQRDDRGFWNMTVLPEIGQQADLFAFCSRAAQELERVLGCLGEIQFKLTLAVTGRCHIDAVDLLPDKRCFGAGTFRLPLLFSRRLAGFPAVTGSEEDPANT